MASAVGLIVVLIPLVPWSYVYECYVRKPGDRWSRTRSVPARLVAAGFDPDEPAFFT